jgi:hypothetical protein
MASCLILAVHWWTFPSGVVLGPVALVDRVRSRLLKSPSQAPCYGKVSSAALMPGGARPARSLCVVEFFG